jgi:hypothetical protein
MGPLSDALPVHCLLTAYSPTIHYLLTIVSLPIRCLFISLFTVVLSSTDAVIHNRGYMGPLCPFAAVWLCLFTAYSLPIHCLCIAYSLPIHSLAMHCLITA